MDLADLLSLLGGVALFLFGMSLMGDSLKRLSGTKLEPVLYKLSGTTVRGVILGTGVTAVIQSSCATAVMTVGFVNSGMMNVRQSIGVIIGAILGTSITGWVICLSYINGTGVMQDLISTATITSVVAVTGILIRMLAKKKNTKYLGEIFMGFAVLMFGMSTMSGSVKGLGEAEWFTNTISSMENPFLGILIGALFTALLQSASASVGIVQALSAAGVINFSVAFPLLLGISVGAATPVLFSAIGANPKGRRTALIYPIVVAFGLIICATLFYIANAIFRFTFLGMTMDPFSIAFVNTMLRLSMVILLTPLVDLIERFANALVPDTTDKNAPGVRLEERFIAYPALAIEQSRLTINEMAEISEKAINQSLSLLADYTEKGFDGVKEAEDVVDAYEDSLGTYLVKLTGRELTVQQNEEVSKYLHTLSDFERISDHALNIAGNAKELWEKEEQFSDAAKAELDVLYAAVSQIVSMTVTAFEETNMDLAMRVEPLEEVIDDLCDKMKLNHIDRLQQGNCNIPMGFVFNDVITNCERVSDHCSNIAVAMIELSASAFQTHEYLHTLREKETPLFRETYDEFARRFAI